MESASWLFSLAAAVRSHTRTEFITVDQPDALVKAIKERQEVHVVGKKGKHRAQSRHGVLSRQS